MGGENRDWIRANKWVASLVSATPNAPLLVHFFHFNGKRVWALFSSGCFLMSGDGRGRMKRGSSCERKECSYASKMLFKK